MKCYSKEWVDKTEKAAYEAGAEGLGTITIFPPGVYQQAWDRGYEEGAKANKVLMRMRANNAKKTSG